MVYEVFKVYQLEMKDPVGKGEEVCEKSWTYVQEAILLAGAGDWTTNLRITRWSLKPFPHGGFSKPKCIYLWSSWVFSMSRSKKYRSFQGYGPTLLQGVKIPPLRSRSQIYIQPHFGTWILLFGPFGQLRPVWKKKLSPVLVILVLGMIQPSGSVKNLMKWGCWGHRGH